MNKRKTKPRYSVGDYVEVEWHDAFTTGKVYYHYGEADKIYSPCVSFVTGEIISLAGGGMTLSQGKHSEPSLPGGMVHSHCFCIPDGMVVKVNILRKRKVNL